MAGEIEVVSLLSEIWAAAVAQIELVPTLAAAVPPGSLPRSTNPPLHH